VILLAGLASWYGPWFDDRPTANGELFDHRKLTAATLALPLGSCVRVTRHGPTVRTVVVWLNDRGPYTGERVIDLSYAAAEKLHMIDDGLAHVIVEASDDCMDTEECYDQTPRFPVCSSA
jgi:rare lipoprotein A